MTVCVCVSQDHEALLRSRQDLEKQLEEQKKTVETQKKRYSDMEVGFVHVHVYTIYTCNVAECSFFLKK